MVTLTQLGQAVGGATETRFTLDIDTAKSLVKNLKHLSKGSYEYRVVVQPIRQAIRAKQSEVNLYTAGFGTSAIARILDENDIAYECK